MPKGKHPVIFCDFDGTITEHDVILMIMREFAPPIWQDLFHEILESRTLSIQEGVKRLFELLPSHKKPEINDFVSNHVRLRAGFDDFIGFCQQQNIPFWVVSGGVDFFIEPVLKPYLGGIGLICNTAHFDAPHITLETPHAPKNCTACNQCACCKVEAMAKIAPENAYTIAIGDSLTDLAMAQHADHVFARDKLKTYLDEVGVPYTPFESFTEIRGHLETLLELA